MVVISVPIQKTMAVLWMATAMNRAHTPSSLVSRPGEGGHESWVWGVMSVSTGLGKGETVRLTAGVQGKTVKN